MSAICWSLTWSPVGQGVGSRAAVTVSPVVVVTALMVLMMTSWLVRGRLRQARVIWENSRCSILFHLEVPGGKWQQVMSSPVSAASAARPAFQARLRYPLPPPASQVTSSLRRARVGVLADEIPPAADRPDREPGGVPVGAHVHEPGVRAHVIDPVRDGVPAALVGEAVAADGHRVAFPAPFPPVLGVLADLLLLLGVHADHRVPGCQVALGLRGDVPELGVPVRVPLSLGDLGAGLGAVPLLVQQPPGGLRAAPVPVRGQRPGQLRTLLVVQASGDSGSPRVESSTRASSAGTRPGSVSASFLRPAPGRRTRPGGAPCPDSSSAAPSATVCHDAPVASPPRRSRRPRPPGPPPPAPAAATSHPAPAAAAPAEAPSAPETPRSLPYHNPGTRHAPNSVNFGMLTGPGAIFRDHGLAHDHGTSLAFRPPGAALVVIVKHF